MGLRYTRRTWSTDELLALMSKAGCKTIWFGVESASEQVLQRIGKKHQGRTSRIGFQVMQEKPYKNSLQLHAWLAWRNTRGHGSLPEIC